MGVLGSMYGAIGAGLAAFSERMLNADPQAGKSSRTLDYGSWNLWEARVTRYDLYWSLYQNNAYRDLVHTWSPRFKSAYGTYKHVRHLYNPSYRLGEFWAGHLMGGMLDRMAGDGESEQSALPIITDNEAVRVPIAKLWRDSQWQVNKEVFTRWGAVLGDTALKVVDDTTRGQVRLELVHPGHLKWCDFDELGIVKSYIIQKRMFDPREASIKDVSPVLDPRTNQKTVIYYEKAYLDGDSVVYETFLNSVPYAWNGVAAAWREPYGFIPLVVAKHETVGLDWGWNAFHAGLSRFLEVDDQASCVGDGNRKDLRAPMLLTGVKGFSEISSPGADRAKRTADQNVNDAEPARSEMPFFTTPSQDARAHPLAMPRDIAGHVEHIRGLLDDIEKNYPELLADTGNLTGTVTAEAVRNARQRASAKVQSRRVGYDDAVALAQRMAVAMGGLGGYEGYEGFGLDDFASGKADHQIGHRPVFEVDPLDAIEEDQAFWTAANAAVKAGVPLALYLERNGWSEEDLKKLGDAKAVADQQTVDMAGAMAATETPPGAVK